MYCFPSLLKCFFLQQNHNFELLPCCNKIYLLWDVSILKCLSSLKKTLKKTLIIEKDTCINRSLFIYGVFIYLTWDIIIIIITFILIREKGSTESLLNWKTSTSSNSVQLPFSYVITQTLETVNVALELDYLHLLKTNFNNYT